MSDRDDVEIVEKADDDEKSVGSPRAGKGSFLYMIKRVFSADDDSTEIDGDDDEQEIIRKPVLFDSTKSAEEKPAQQEQTDSSLENEMRKAVPIEPPKEPDPIEEEEFLMISAFLEGEEYQAPTPEKDNAEYDIQNAYDEEDVVFDVDDENESSDTDKYLLLPENVENSDEISNKEQLDKPVEEKTEEEQPEKPVDEISDKEQLDKLVEEKTEEEQPEKPIDEISDEKQPEKPADEISDEKQPEKPVDEISDEIQSDKPTDEDNKETDETDDQILTEPLDIPYVDDEEFIIEEELLFDESGEEEELAAVDEFGGLTFVNADSGKVPKTKEYGLNDDMSEPLEEESKSKSEDKPEEEDKDQAAEKREDDSELDDNSKPEEKTEDKPEDSSKPEEKTEDKPEDSSKPEEKTEDKPEDSSKPEEKAEDKPEEKAENKTDEKPESKPETTKQDDIFVDEFEDISSTSIKPEPKGVKGAFSKIKKKLVEMWNTKEEPEKTPDDDQDENDGWVYNTSRSKDTPKAAPIRRPESTQKNDPEAKPETKPEQHKRPELVVLSDNTEKAETETETESKSESEIKTEKPVVSESQQQEQHEKAPETVAEDQKPILTKTGMQIEVIKNDNVSHSEVDEDEVRGSLNVIKQKASDVLTEEQKREIEESRRTLKRAEAVERDSEREKSRLDHEQQVAAELEFNDYHPEGHNSVKFAVGRFGESVKTEYECIVNYRKMISVSSKEALIDRESDKKPEKPRKTVMPEIGQSEIPELQEAREFERNHDKIDSIGKRLDYRDERSPEPVEYRSEEDEEYVRDYLNNIRQRDYKTYTVTAALTVAAFLVSCFAGAFTVGKATESLASSQRTFTLIELILFAVSAFVNRDLIIEGLKPLKQFKTNADTGAAAAVVATGIQALIALISPRAFLSQGMNLYILPVMLVLSVFAVGRYMNSDRMAANFRFMSDPAQKYAGKFFPDPRKVATLLSGTRSDKTELSYQKKATFLNHFVRISRTEDPGDKLSSRFSLPSIIAAVLVALIGGIAAKSFFDGWSVLCVMLCVGIPIGSRVLASVPMHTLSKNSLLNKSMISSYFAVETFSESAAVMIDAKDLYPEGSIQMEDFKALDPYRWQDGLYAAAAVTMAVGGAMTGVFDGMIKKSNRANIPVAENVIIEDGKGIIGTVKNDRVFVGNAKLLRAHGILAPDETEEEQFRQNGDEPVYIAINTTLVGVILVRYTANRRVADVLKHMESADMSLLVRTTDPNITAERIARDFRINVKCVKVLETKNSNFIRNEMVGKEKTAPAFVATRGGVMSFGLAVSECIRMKRNVSLSLAVEIVGALLRIFIIGIIIIFAGVHYLGAIKLSILSLAWVWAVLAAPKIVKFFSKEH